MLRHVAAWDSFGNLFLVNINAAINAVVLYLSTDGGANFTTLQTIDTGSIDQPSVKVGAGSVWVTWNDGTIKARGAAVTGLGAANIGAFTSEQAAPNANTVSGQFGDIAVGPSGQVVVTYQSNTDIYVNTDADGLGAGGFGSQVHVTSTNVAKFDFIPAQSSRSIDAEANLAWDRSGGAHNGRLYLVYTDETPDESNNTDIYVRYSDDNGATWSSAVKVNDDATTNSQLLPNISVDQTTGDVAVTWHDARNDPANNNTQFFGAVSDTGGASFGANFQISTGTSDDDTAGSGVDYGDYTWADSYGNVLHPVWADNSNSTGDNPDGTNSRFDIYTAAIVIDNTPPVLTVPGDQTVDFNDPLSFNVSATDANASDTLSFSASGLPAGLSLTDHGDGTATVSGTDAAHPGVYPATITVTDNHNPPVSKPVQITVTKEESAIALSGTFTQDYHDPYIASATLTDPDGGLPIANKLVTFQLGVGDGCSTMTDVTGLAQCSITPTQPAGSVSLAVSFGPDTDYVSASDSHSFVMTKEETTTRYTGPLVIANGLSATLSGQLLEDGTTPISGRALTLSVGSNSCVTPATDASGNASCTIPVVSVPPGPVTVKADFAGDGFYLPSSESKDAIVFAFPARGVFVLGDTTVAGAGPTTSVTYWGAQWSTLNVLSGGSPEPSFKGFAGDTTTPPMCGSTWTTRPGNSSAPVPTVPSYMGVAVASTVAKSGSTVSGDIVHIVVVKTDSGYAPDPGGAGTGTIVASYC